MWLAKVPDEAVDQVADLAETGKAMSLAAALLPSLQRVGDAVVYCGESNGILVGIGEVAGDPHRKPSEPGAWRIRVIPRLIVDRTRAPSITETGMQPPRLPRRLEPHEFEQLQALMTPAAASLDTEAEIGG